MNTFYEFWGTKTPAEAKAKIEEQRKEIKREPQNLEEQAVALVGREVYEKLIKGYTEKQWGRSWGHFIFCGRLAENKYYDMDKIVENTLGIEL